MAISQIKKLVNTQTSKDTAVLFAGNAISSVLAIAFTVIAARVLGPSSWGVVASVIAFMAIINALADFGLGASLFKFGTHIAQIFTIRFITALAVFVLVLLLGNTLTLVSGVGIAAYLLFDFLVFYEQSQKNFKRAATFIVSSNLVRIIVTLGIYLAGAVSVVSILGAYAISPLFVFVFLYWQNRASLKFNFDFRRPKNAFKFSGWMGINRVVAVTQGRLDTLLVIGALGSYEAGIFAAAKQLALGVPLIIGSFATVLAPRFGQMHRSKLRSYFIKTIYLSAILAAGLIFGIIISPFIIRLFGAQYSSASSVLRGMLFAYLPFVLATPAVNLLIYGFGRPSLIFILSVLQLIVFLAVNTLFLPSIGVSAPVLALGVVNLLQFVYAYGFALYYLNR